MPKYQPSLISYTGFTPGAHSALSTSSALYAAGQASGVVGGGSSSADLIPATLNAIKELMKEVQQAEQAQTKSVSTEKDMLMLISKLEKYGAINIPHEVRSGRISSSMQSAVSGVTTKTKTGSRTSKAAVNFDARLYTGVNARDSYPHFSDNISVVFLFCMHRKWHKAASKLINDTDLHIRSMHVDVLIDTIRHGWVNGAVHLFKRFMAARHDGSKPLTANFAIKKVVIESIASNQAQMFDNFMKILFERQTKSDKIILQNKDFFDLLDTCVQLNRPLLIPVVFGYSFEVYKFGYNNQGLVFGRKSEIDEGFNKFLFDVDNIIVDTAELNSSTRNLGPVINACTASLRARKPINAQLIIQQHFKPHSDGQIASMQTQPRKVQYSAMSVVSQAPVARPGYALGAHVQPGLVPLGLHPAAAAAGAGFAPAPAPAPVFGDGDSEAGDIDPRRMADVASWVTQSSSTTMPGMQSTPVMFVPRASVASVAPSDSASHAGQPLLGPSNRGPGSSGW